MNTASKGRRNEHRGREFFENLGWVVIRSAGSFGLADLVAFGYGSVWLINGKTNQWAPPKEREALKRLANEIFKMNGMNVTALLMRFDDGCTLPKFKSYDANPEHRRFKEENDYLPISFGGDYYSTERKDGTEKGGVATRGRILRPNQKIGRPEKEVIARP